MAANVPLLTSLLLLSSCTSVIIGGESEQGGKNDSLDGADAGPSVPVQTICDSNLGNAASDLAKAMELCDGSLLSINLESARPEQHGVVSSYGQTYTPKAGSAMANIATASISPGEIKDEGGVFDAFSNHPFPKGDPADGCGYADPLQVQDQVKVELRLRAPDGATGFQFDFNFMSAEFPEYFCTEYDDTFLAVLNSQDIMGNISYDENDNVISINTGFFDVCNPAFSTSCKGAQDLTGTGYETFGGTGWLTTTAPINPGEEFTLTFYLFDEGDGALASQVLLDNFMWLAADVPDNPKTID